MLQRLRDKTSGWIATIVLGLLIIPFAFVGVTDYLGGGNASRLVRVQAPPSWWASAPSWWPASLLWKHVDIGAEEFRTRFEQARQQQREAEGDAFDSRAFETRENKLKVLDQLIDEKVVQLASDQAGIAVTGFLARRTPVDQQRRAPGLLEMKRDRDADDTGAENDRIDLHDLLLPTPFP